MQIHELKTPEGTKDKKRVGRGGKRGKTSGRGHKGQKARAGNSMRPDIRDRIKKIPKKRGYKFGGHAAHPTVVNVNTINEKFTDGETVTPQTLFEKGIIDRSNGRLPEVKILGDGELSTKLSVSACYVSGSAREKIESAGGSIIA